MAIRYSYDSETGLLHIIGHGFVSMEERIHGVRRILDDPDLPSDAAILIDVNGVTNLPNIGDFQAIGMLIERLRSRFGGRVAIVNVTVGHVTMSHLVALSVEGNYSNVQVFPSDSAARAWLVPSGYQDRPPLASQK